LIRRRNQFQKAFQKIKAFEHFAVSFFAKLRPDNRDAYAKHDDADHQKMDRRLAKIPVGSVNGYGDAALALRAGQARSNRPITSQSNS
jgi:hypothetical protein